VQRYVLRGEPKNEYHDIVSKGPMQGARHSNHQLKSSVTKATGEMRETELVGDVDEELRGDHQQRSKCRSRKAVIAHSLSLWMFWFELANEFSDSGVSSPSPGSVTALGLDVVNRKILLGQSLVGLGQLVVSEMGDDADFLLGNGSAVIVIGTLGDNKSTTHKRGPGRRDSYQGRGRMRAHWCFLVAWALLTQGLTLSLIPIGLNDSGEPVPLIPAIWG